MPDFNDVREQHLDVDTLAWFVGVLETIERLVPADYTALMTDDVVLRLPDGAELRGKAEIEAAFDAAWPALRGLVHHERNVWGDQRYVVHEARVVSTLSDGSTVTADSTSWIDRAEDGRITSARVYG